MTTLYNSKFSNILGGVLFSAFLFALPTYSIAEDSCPQSEHLVASYPMDDGNVMGQQVNVLEDVVGGHTANCRNTHQFFEGCAKKVQGEYGDAIEFGTQSDQRSTLYVIPHDDALSTASRTYRACVNIYEEADFDKQDIVMTVNRRSTGYKIFGLTAKEMWDNEYEMNFMLYTNLSSSGKKTVTAEDLQYGRTYCFYASYNDNTKKMKLFADINQPGTLVQVGSKTLSSSPFDYDADITIGNYLSSEGNSGYDDPALAAIGDVGLFDAGLTLEEAQADLNKVLGDGSCTGEGASGPTVDVEDVDITTGETVRVNMTGQPNKPYMLFVEKTAGPGSGGAPSKLARGRFDANGDATYELMIVNAGAIAGQYVFHMMTKYEGEILSGSSPTVTIAP